jgi:hypothetical protein
LREEVLMEVKTAEMEQHGSLSGHRADGDVHGVESDVDEDYEQSSIETAEAVALRREVHGALDKICAVEPWTHAKQLLKEVSMSDCCPSCAFTFQSEASPDGTTRAERKLESSYCSLMQTFN